MNNKAIYITIANCTCPELNQNKLKTLNVVKDWIDSEMKRCVRLFSKGYSYRQVYHSFDNNILSVYKAKITSCAAFYFKHWYTGKKAKKSKTYKMSGCNKSWVYEKCITQFDIKKDYSTKFQLKVSFKLPFEINGKSEITLLAKVPKKFWKRIKATPLYKKGFHLLVYRNYVEINLVSKIIQKPQSNSQIKAIYISPYGGIHTASMFDIKQLYNNEELRKNIKEFYTCCYGISKESKETQQLLERIKSYEHKDTYHQDIEQLIIKCKTRVNKFFETLDNKQTDGFYHRIVVGIIADNTTITDIIQDACIEQIQKCCKLRNIKYDEVYMTQKELMLEAKYTMKKSEREQLKENQKPTNRFRAAAILKKSFKDDNIKFDNKSIKIGIVYKTKSSACRSSSIEMTDTSENSEVTYSQAEASQFI